jgi:coproporphyrinogen III oxidase-like Fe-S oxidoreductase
MALLTERLAAYLMTHAQRYKRIVAYVTVRAYRQVVEDAFAIFREQLQGQGMSEAAIADLLILAPASVHSGGGTKELLQHAHLHELLAKLYPDTLHTTLAQTALGLDASAVDEDAD